MKIACPGMAPHNGAMSEVTRILSQIDAGDPAAAEQLLPLVYDELRKLAAAKLAHEKPGQTLQATALVHEAYLRLVGPVENAVRGVLPTERERGREAEGEVNASLRISQSPNLPLSPSPSSASPQPRAPAYDTRGHFFAAAAQAMRRILVESARRKQAEKRGGDACRQDLHDLEIAAAEIPEDLLALDDALVQLAAIDKPAADLVHLRYFAGLSIPDAAEVLGISPRTAARLWAYARSWLRVKIEGSVPPE